MIEVNHADLVSGRWRRRDTLFPPIEAALEITAGKTTVFEVPGP